MVERLDGGRRAVGRGLEATATPQFLGTREAGAFLTISPRTLEKHRLTGSGPVYRKLGGRVVYALADLIAWADLCTRRSTADASLSTTRSSAKR
jgi:hypothetical protein